MACCDHRYGRPPGRPRVSGPATYCSITPQLQLPAVARWHDHLYGLATSIHEICGLFKQKLYRRSPRFLALQRSLEPTDFVCNPSLFAFSRYGLEMPLILLYGLLIILSQSCDEGHRFEMRRVAGEEFSLIVPEHLGQVLSLICSQISIFHRTRLEPQ